MNNKNNENNRIYANRIDADCHKVWTKEEAEDELYPFIFKGPGWYLTKRKNGSEDAMLVMVDSVLPIMPKQSDGLDLCAYWRDQMKNEPFAKTWPDDTKFRFYVYNVTSPLALFQAIANAPVRQDER